MAGTSELWRGGGLKDQLGPVVLMKGQSPSSSHLVLCSCESSLAQRGGGVGAFYR